MRHVACSMDRTSGGTTSPWHYTITWGESTAFNGELYRDPGGQAVHQARLRVTYSPCPSFINFFASISSNVSLNILSLITQSWTLKELGALCSLGQGQNSPSPLWTTLVKLILYYRAQWYKFSGTVPLTRYLILNIHLCDLWKNPKIYRNTSDSFAKIVHSGLFFSFFPSSVYDIWVNIFTRDISVSLQNCFHLYYTIAIF